VHELLSRGWKPATINVYVRVLRCWLRWLYIEGLLKENLAAHVKPLRVPPRGGPRLERLRLLRSPHGHPSAGRPRSDKVFRMADGSYHIVDYKTVRITNRQDELFPQYEAQLNAYAFIAERLGYSPVTRLWLLYLEPRPGQAGSTGSRELTLSFAPQLKPVALNEGLIRRLLERAQELLSLERPPMGRDGCDHCQRLERLLALLHVRGPSVPF